MHGKDLPEQAGAKGALGFGEQLKPTKGGLPSKSPPPSPLPTVTLTFWALDKGLASIRERAMQSQGIRAKVEEAAAGQPRRRRI